MLTHNILDSAMVNKVSPDDTTIVSKILPILQIKRIIHKVDVLLMDRAITPINWPCKNIMFRY